MSVKNGDLITDGTVTWKVKDTRLPENIKVADSSNAGLMSSLDKQLLDALYSAPGPTDINIIANKPYYNGDKTYNGSSYTAVWGNYDQTKMTISGTTYATNAGSYTAYFTPKSGYRWTDNTTNQYSVTWVIKKAANTISVANNALTVYKTVGTNTTTTTTTTLSYSGAGAVSATSNNTNIATCSWSNNVLTVTAKNAGTATISIVQAEGSNHNQSNTVTVTVTVSEVQPLANCTPAQIKQVAATGKAGQYWNVGDTVAIVFNGTINGSTVTTFSNETYYAFILGFDHNSSKEGTKRIHFQLYKDSTGKDLCVYGVQMNSTNTNAGGWASCEMRTSRMPEVLATFPSAWQNVISNTTKYTDNTGGGVDDASYVTATTDKCFLLSEFEVHGVRTYANSYEQNYQQQYTYYANGNSKVKANNTGRANSWWYRCPIKYSYAYEVTSYLNFFGAQEWKETPWFGGATNEVYGLAPGFCIAG